MAKQLTKEGWRALRVFNSAELCRRGGRGVYVSYCPAQAGREARFAYWCVLSPGSKTDPGGHWSDGYNKTFTVRARDEKEAKRLEAIAWAAEVYKIEGEWERDPWGDYHPAGTLEAARVSRIVGKEG